MRIDGERWYLSSAARQQPSPAPDSIAQCSLNYSRSLAEWPNQTLAMNNQQKDGISPQLNDVTMQQQQQQQEQQVAPLICCWLYIII